MTDRPSSHDVECTKCDRMELLFQRQMSDFQVAAEKRFDKLERMIERQEEQSQKRAEERTRTIEALRETISTGPAALAGRTISLEEKMTVLNRVIGLLATGTVMTALTVIGAILMSALHVK